MTTGTMKFKIIILAAVVAGFILTIFMLNIIAGAESGNISAHSIAFESMPDFVKTTVYVNHNYNHQDLVSVYFLL